MLTNNHGFATFSQSRVNGAVFIVRGVFFCVIACKQQDFQTNDRVSNKEEDRVISLHKR